MATGDIHIEKDHDKNRLRVAREIASGSKGTITLPSGATFETKDWRLDKVVTDEPFNPSAPPQSRP